MFSEKGTPFLFQTCLSQGLAAIRTLSGVILAHSQPPLCPCDQSISLCVCKTNCEYAKFLHECRTRFCYLGFGEGRSMCCCSVVFHARFHPAISAHGLEQALEELDSSPGKWLSSPPLHCWYPHYQCHPGSTCRHLGPVLCTHNPTSLKLMQSPRKSHLCSFNTGKDQRLTSAQRLSVALDQMACHCLCSCRHDAESNGTGIC